MCNGWFPPTGEVASFERPDCGHDDFANFAGQDVWVNTEEVGQ
jgi:hypothetical protein